MALNRIYKVVWSKTKGCYVVVSELAKRVGRNKAKAIVISSAAMAVAVSSVVTSTVGAVNPAGTGGGEAVAWGTGSTANGVSAAIGNGAQATGGDSFAVLWNAKATGDTSMAIGNRTTASGDNSVALGSSGTAATADSAVAIGKSATSSGGGAVALGKEANATGGTAVALGQKSSATGGDSAAIGWGSEASAQKAMAFGNSSKASGENSIAFGYKTQATSGDAVAIGSSASVSGGSAVAIGNSSKATGSESAAIGLESKAVGSKSMAFGRSSTAKLEDDIAFGFEAATRDQGVGYSIAIGAGAMSGTNAGFLSRNGKDGGGVAIGTGAYTGINQTDGRSMNSSVAVGAGAGTGFRSYAINGMPEGNATDVDTNDEVLEKAFGVKNVGDYKDIAGGTNGYTNVDINEATALGRNARAIGDQAVAIGAQTIAGHGAVALGGNDITQFANKQYYKSTRSDFAVTDTVDHNQDAKISGETVSSAFNRLVGTALDITYKATYAQDGSVVLGAQAHSGTPLGTALGTNALVRKGAFGATAIGAGSQIQANAEAAVAIGMGAVANGSYAVAAGTASRAEVSAVAAGYKAKAGASAVSVGESSEAVNSSVAVGQLAKAKKVADIAVGQGAVASGEQGAIAVGLGTNAQGDSSIMIGGANVESASKQKTTFEEAIGIDKPGGIIEKDVTEHVNGKEIHRKYTFAATKTTAGTVADAFKELTGRTMDIAALDFSKADNKNGHASTSLGVHSLAKGDLATAIGASARANAIGSLALGTGAQATRQNAVAIGTGSTTDLLGTRQLSVNYNSNGEIVSDDSPDVAYTFKWAGGTHTSEGDVVSFGSPGAERQLKNVAAGRVAEDSTDAINGSQLNSITKKIAAGFNASANLVAGSTGTFTSKKLNADSTKQDYETSIRSEDKVQFQVGNNLKLERNETESEVEVPDDFDKTKIVRKKVRRAEFAYSLNPELTNLKSATFKNDAGDTTVIDGAGVTVTPVATGKQAVSLTTAGLNNGGNAISNVAGNLPSTQNSTTNNTEANPSNATKSQDAPNTTTATGNNYVSPNNAATVGDVLNAGWNLQGNSAAVDFVKPYDTVNFIDGDGTTATVDSKDGKTSTVKYSVNLGDGLKKDDATNKITVNAADKSLAVEKDGVKVNPADKSLEVTKNGLKVKTDGTTIATDDTNGLKVVTGEIEPVKTGATAGTVKVKENDAGKIATVDSVVNAVNSAAFTLKASADGGTRNASSGVTVDGESIKAGSTIEMIAGKNLDVKHDASGKITFATVDSPSFTTVQVGGDEGPKFSKTADGNISVSDKDGTNPVKITNVQDGDVSANSKDAINGSQFHKLANNTIQLKGQNGTDAATETKKQELNKKDGIAFTVKSSDGTLLDVAASGDTITLTPKTATLTTGADGVPTATTTNGKLVTADDLVTALKGMGWKAIAGKDGTGTVTGEAEALVKAGETVTFKAGDNLAIKQDGKNFIYSLKPALSGLTSAEFKDANNNAVNITPEGITITKPADAANNKPEKTVKLNQDGLDNGGNAISNVKSNLPDTKNNDATTGPSTATKSQEAPNTTDKNGNNYISPNNAATVGDVLNAGWNLQGNGTEVDFVKPYDTVNFVNGLNTTAVVSTVDGKTSNVTYNVTGLPVTYTTADGTPVTKIGDKYYKVNDQGQPVDGNGAPVTKFNKDGKPVDADGNPVPEVDITTNPLTTSVVNPKADAGKTGTTTPTTLTNVEGNLDGAKTNTKAPTTNAAAPNTADATQPNYVNTHNAATVGDVLQAGWNLQNNGTAKDFVKPYDTVNFVDGGNTTAVVTTKADGTTSDVTFNVTGLPVTNTITDNGKEVPVVKVGNTFYPAKPDGTPDIQKGQDGNPTNGYVQANDGKVYPRDAVTITKNQDGTTTVTPNTDATPKTVNTNLVNPNVANTTDKPGNNVNTPNQLGNVANGAKTFDPVDGKVLANDGKWYPADKVEANGKPKDGATPVANPLAPKNAAGDVLEKGNDGKWYKADELTNGTPKPTATEQTPVARPANSEKSGLIDFNNSNPNNAATIGDLQNMGWVVSAEGNNYSDQVRNANEVKFVGEGTATVTGKTVDGVRTITVKVDDQTSTNNAVTPVVYTKEDGTQVYPTGKKDDAGNQIFNTKPDGKGDTVTGPVKTTVNGPKGTSTPTTLSNVEGNLDGAKTNTAAPTTNAAAPNTADATQPNYVNTHNAATVGDVLQAGWNLQGNGSAVDFVKPYDTVNFVNGLNTTAVVSTVDGKTSNVTYNVTGLPITYTDKDGKPVSKIGDNFYTVNEKGQPLDSKGNPSTKVNNEGKPVDDAGNVIDPINTTNNPVKTSLVNPAPGANKTGTTSPTTLDNVTSKLANYNGAPVNGKDPVKNGLRDLTNTNVTDNTVATVGDIRNMGWIVSSDKKTDDLTKDYSDTVKNANEVKFVGEGAAIVSGKTDAQGVRTITVGVDVQKGINQTVTPVNYTKADGTKVYPKEVDNGDGTKSVKFYPNPDGTGNEVPKGDVITSINGPEGTTSPTTLKNVKNNIPTVDDKKKQAFNPDGTEVTEPNTTTNTGNAKAPITAAKAQDLNTPYKVDDNGNYLDEDGNITTDPKKRVENPNYIGNNAATVSDVLNAGWNLQNNGTAKDFVKPYDTVNFVNGGNTTAVVTTNAEGTASDVTFNVTGLPITNTITDNGKEVPVVKVGNTFYPAKPDGTPDIQKGQDGNPTNGYVQANDGKVYPRDAVTITKNQDGTTTVTPNTDATPKTVNTNLVNPNVANTTDKPGNNVNTPSQLGNVANGAKTFEPVAADGTTVTDAKPAVKLANDGKWYPADKVEANGKPKDGATPVANPLAPKNAAGDALEKGNDGKWYKADELTNGTPNPTATEQTPVAKPANSEKSGLIDFNNSNPNNAATIGDLQNMGWVVSAEGNNYSDQVRNANEVKFVGEGTATVTGKTDDKGVRTITVKVDDQTSTNNAVTPVVYTDEQGNQVYPTGKKDNDGNQIFNTQPDGKGNTVTGPVKTTVNGPKGTSTPTTLSNVEGNLDGAKTGTKAPTDKHDAPNTADTTQPNYVNTHNAATVGDVLQAGWNLQNNGAAKDFVKPYDTVNFVNGGNTTAVVTTNAEGTASDVTFNVTGLPISNTITDNGKEVPVVKVGNTFYPAKPDGTPDIQKGQDGNPTNGYVQANDGKVYPRDAVTITKNQDGTTTVTPNTDATPKTVNTNLVNPNVANTTDKPGNNVNTPNQLGNVANGAKTFDPVAADGTKLVQVGDKFYPADKVENGALKPGTDATADAKDPVKLANDGKWYPADKVEANGKPKDGATPVANPLAPKNATGDVLEKGNDGKWYKADELTNGKPNTGATEQQPVPRPANSEKSGLIDFNNSNPNNAATIGDLQNMGWVVSAEGNNYSDQVRNANEVKFVGEGTATVTGKTDDKGVRTITVKVDDQTSTNNSVTPVVYTKADGTQVYPTNKKDDQGHPIFNTKADGSGDPVPNTEVITSVNGPEGTTSPTTLKNVKNNIPNVNDGTQEITNPDGTVVAKTPDQANINKAPLTAAKAAELANPKTKEGQPNPNYIGNNAATVSDVLNAGWNLQNNGAAKDFVKPFDTVNFVNGGNTTAVVSTSEDGTTSHVTFNVTGLPMTYTTADGSPVSKVGDKYYKVNDKGQPITADGKPAVKTNADGKPVTEDGTVIDPIDTATNPLQSNLVNPNVNNATDAPNKQTTTPTQLGNVANGAKTFDPVDGKVLANDGKWYPADKVEANGKPKDGATAVENPLAPKNAAGEPLVQAKDGKWYKPSDLQPNGTPTPTAQPQDNAVNNKAGLVDFSNSNPNNAATIGDLQNMGWVVSAQGNSYSDQVRNANEVKFVGEGTATVTGKTDDKGVRTITVKVDDQVSTNNSVTPVVYTDKDGNTVYPIKDDQGNVTYHTTPDGKGENDKVIPNNDVNTSINGPKDDKGNIRPASLSNVKNNIPAVNDADKKVTNPDGTDKTNAGDVANINKAPLTAEEAADLLKPTTKDGKANSNFVGNNAATVSDVLNAGWNLQNNGAAKDFVKPFDTVNFVNGGNTTAVVSTSEDGTTSHVTYNVTGLPMTYTTADGSPVSKVGDKYYKVNDKGQPITADGKPAVKTNADGKPVTEDGTVIEPIDTTANPLHSNLVNPNVTNTADAPNKQTTSPTQLGNITSGLNKYGDQVNGVEVPGTTDKNRGLVDLSKPANGQPAVSDNTAATVGDLRNMGWIVSSDKKTDDLTKEYSDTVKNANEVRFVGEGTAIVSGKTDDKGVRTITVKVDDQTSTNNSVTPVNYTTKDGTKVYPVKDDAGNVTYHTTPDGKGKGDTTIDPKNVVTSVNGPDGTTTPTTLQNVKNNIPNVNDGSKTITNPDGTEKAGDVENINKAPLTAEDAAKLSNPKTADGAANPNYIGNNAATVSDVLNAGWNLQNNGTAKDFVKPYDTVNFINGLGTTAVVTTREGNTASDVTFNVKPANGSVTVDEDGVKVTTGEITPKPNGAVEGPTTPENAKTLKDALDAAVKELATAKDALKTAEKALEANPTDAALQKAVEDKKAEVAAKQTPVNEAQKAHDDAGLNKVATVQNVAEAINNAGFNLKTSADGGEKLAGSKDDGELIKPSNTVEMVAGNNLTVKQDENGKITYATKDDVTFTNVNAGTLNVGSPNTYTDGKGNTYTKVGDKYYNPADVVNGAPKEGATPVDVTTTPVTPVSPVTMKTEAAKPATNNATDAQPSSALNITSQDGKPTQITGVGSTLNTKAVDTNPTGTAPGATPNTTPVNLVDLEGTADAPVNKNAVATVGDLQNMGWVVSAKDGNGYKDVVKNANVVDFKGDQGVTVTGKTLADGTREITVGIKEGEVTNKVTITHADGSKTDAIKIGDKYYKVGADGKPEGYKKGDDGKPAGTPLPVAPTDKVTNTGAGFVIGNTVANAIQESGWNVGIGSTDKDFSKDAKVYDKVNPNDDVKFANGANTNVSMVTVDALNEDGTKKATTFVKVDVNRDLKIDSVTTGGTATDKNGNNLVKVGDKYYKEGDVTIVKNPDGTTTVTPNKDAKPVPPADVIPAKDGAMIVKNADGKDVVSATVGKDGSGVFGVNGKDGKDGVSITAKDGEGAIGVNGKDGKNTSITGESITIKDKDNKNSTNIGIDNITLKDEAGNTNTSQAAKTELKDKAGNTNTNTSTSITLADKDKNTNTSTAAGTTYTDKDKNTTTVGPKEIVLRDKDGNNTSKLTNNDLLLNTKDPKTGVEKTSHMSGDKISFNTTDEIEKGPDGKPVIDPKTNQPKIKNPGNSTEYTNEGLKVIPNSTVARDANGNITFLDKDGKPVTKDKDGNYAYVGKDGQPGEKYTGPSGALKPNVVDNTRVISFGMDKPVLDANGNPVKGPDGKPVMTEGISAGMQQIHNVAPGTKDTDGVNVSQLRGATININNRMNRMGAQAAALAGLQSIQYDPLEPTQISAGLGYYKGSSALALGINHYKNESTMFHMGASLNGRGDETMMNASVTWKFGARADETAVKDTFRQGPISASYTLQDKVSALEAQNKIQKDQLNELRATNAAQKAENEAQREELALMKAQIAELFKRMNG